MYKTYADDEIYPTKKTTPMISELPDRTHLQCQFHDQLGRVYTLNREVTTKTRKRVTGYIEIVRHGGRPISLPDTHFRYPRKTFHTNSFHGCLDHNGLLYITVSDDITQISTLTRYRPQGLMYVEESQIDIAGMGQCLIIPTIGQHDQYPIPQLVVLGVSDRDTSVVWRHLPTSGAMTLGKLYKSRERIPKGSKLPKIGFADRTNHSALRLEVLVPASEPPVMPLVIHDLTPLRSSKRIPVVRSTV